MYRNNKNMIKRSVEQLSAELMRALRIRKEEEQYTARTGSIVPARLWKVGRMEDPGALFEKTVRRYSGEFVVDILMDASGSQRDRQGQVALQA